MYATEAVLVTRIYIVLVPIRLVVVVVFNHQIVAIKSELVKVKPYEQQKDVVVRSILIPQNVVIQEDY